MVIPGSILKIAFYGNNTLIALLCATLAPNCLLLKFYGAHECPEDVIMFPFFYNA